MLAELNKMVFSPTPHLRQDPTEAQRRRQGRRSVVPKAEDARSRQGRHFEHLVYYTVAFYAEF